MHPVIITIIIIIIIISSAFCSNGFSIILEKLPTAAGVGWATLASVFARSSWPLKSQHKVIKFPLLTAAWGLRREPEHHCQQLNNKKKKHHGLAFNGERSHFKWKLGSWCMLL